MTDPDRLADKALDALDWDYGGDMAEYLGHDWRQILRRHILNALAEADAEVERLRDLLARLERAAGEYGDTCPACGAMTGTTPIPHTPDCWLAAEIRGPDLLK
jgi:hypothetical protein